MGSESSRGGGAGSVASTNAIPWRHRLSTRLLVLPALLFVVSVSAFVGFD